MLAKRRNAAICSWYCNNIRNRRCKSAWLRGAWGTPESRNRVGTTGGSDTGWDVGVVFELVHVLVLVAVFELVRVDLAGYWLFLSLEAYWLWLDLKVYYLFSNLEAYWLFSSLEAYCLGHELFHGILSRSRLEIRPRTQAKTLLRRRLPQRPWGFEEHLDLERGWTRHYLSPLGTL